MIDIFTTDSYSNPMGLLLESGIEILHYLAGLTVILVLFLLAKRYKQIKPLFFILLFAMLMLRTVIVWRSGTRSEFFYAACLASLLTGQLWLLHALPLKIEDYIFFFSGVFFSTRLFNSTSSVFGDLWLFWLIFGVCYLTAKISLNKLRGNHFGCYLSFVAMALSAYSFRLSVFGLQSIFTPVFGSTLALPAAAAPAMILLPIGILFLRDRLRGRLLELNRMGGAYPKLEKAFVYVSGIILLVNTLVFLPFTFWREQNTMVLILFPLLCITFLLAQMAMILLVIHAAFYRDSVRFEQQERQNLSAYYKSLTGSLNAMREMRHDIKNIFFTMGNFVDRSEDEEMKAFFWEKIYPYSQDTIRQSELLSAIYQIPNESLRAFFSLKLSQAQQKKIRVSFAVNLEDEQFAPAMDIIDLTRILGILLDNAIEEAENIPGAEIFARVNSKLGHCSFAVKNNISEETRRRGIHPGKSSKGSGHGNGLIIVRQILDRYPNAVLNSVVLENTFTQSLTL